jgi:hypothetical protein
MEIIACFQLESKFEMNITKPRVAPSIAYRQTDTGVCETWEMMEFIE